jgi:hypothetical protein
MAKKTVLIVLGAVLLLCGLGCAVPGALLAAVTGTDNTLSSGFHPVGTSTPALVSETARISDAAPVDGSALGDTALRITARSDDTIFIGVADATLVDQYLSGVAYEEVRDLELSPYRVETVRHDGRSEADPPVDEVFWVASATGNAPTLEWPVTDGDYRIVIMNADGSPAVGAEAQFGVQVKGLFGVGLGVLIVAVLVGVVGLVLLIVGIRTRTRPHANGQPPG